MHVTGDLLKFNNKQSAAYLTHLLITSCNTNKPSAKNINEEKKYDVKMVSDVDPIGSELDLLNTIYGKTSFLNSDLKCEDV